MRAVALIPLRGGSQSIPRKNIRPLAGRPLCAWVIASCLESGIFAEVWVSTDDDEIAEVAERWGAQVHRRAPETATNTATSESALLDFLAAHPVCDVLTLVQATSPLTTPRHLREAWGIFRARGADSLVTVTRRHGFRWSDDGVPQNYDPSMRPRRQDWDGELFENGAFYFTRTEILRDSGCRLGGEIAVFEMEPEHGVEADDPHDWLHLESLVQRSRLGNDS